MAKKISIIGGGFAGISAACFLANDGYEVHIYEKNNYLGGRAQQLKAEGFIFDMGPTFYWMPDVFEHFFNAFGKKSSDYYSLNRLDPSYRVYFGENEFTDLPADREKLKELFESLEKGAGNKLERFLRKAQRNYNIAIKQLVYKPGFSLLELVTLNTVTRLDLFIKTIRSQVKAQFKNQKIRSILEFPVLFLGAKPSTTPAFYNFMNYADLELGTWYPKGGMYSVAQGMAKLAEELGVKLHLNAAVEKIETINGQIHSLRVNGESHTTDIVLAGADYRHAESLLSASERTYDESYWQKKTFAPSALMFYLGFNKKIKAMQHHTLFFDEAFDPHAEEIYDNPQWPSKPLFYTSFPSMSEEGLAPPRHESCIVLIPIAPGLEDKEPIRKKYLEMVLDRIERISGQKLRSSLVFEQSYSVKDFVKDYNSYKGNAYGLANTLFQTAWFRPKLKSKKVRNLYFTGQLTVPGPGVPPSLISGEIVAGVIKKEQPIKS